METDMYPLEISNAIQMQRGYNGLPQLSFAEHKRIVRWISMQDCRKKRLDARFLPRERSFRSSLWSHSDFDDECTLQLVKELQFSDGTNIDVQVNAWKTVSNSTTGKFVLAKYEGGYILRFDDMQKYHFQVVYGLDRTYDQTNYHFGKEVWTQGAWMDITLDQDGSLTDIEVHGKSDDYGYTSEADAIVQNVVNQLI